VGNVYQLCRVKNPLEWSCPRYHSSLSYFIDHDITYLVITSLSGEVGLVEYICTNRFVVMFLAVDPDYVPEEFE
jgi:hypothetical protein